MSKSQEVIAILKRQGKHVLARSFASAERGGRNAKQKADWMKKFQDASVKLGAHPGQLKWDDATYLFMQGMRPEEAAKKVYGSFKENIIAELLRAGRPELATILAEAATVKAAGSDPKLSVDIDYDEWDQGPLNDRELEAGFKQAGAVIVSLIKKAGGKASFKMVRSDGLVEGTIPADRVETLHKVLKAVDKTDSLDSDMRLWLPRPPGFYSNWELEVEEGGRRLSIGPDEWLEWSQSSQGSATAANPSGKAQVAIMDYLKDPGSGKVALTDIAAHPSFRGVHFAKIQKAAEVLNKKGLIKFDGINISRAMVTAAPGYSRTIGSGKFDYEGAEAGVKIVASPPHVHAHVYYPLENIGKRGKNVEVTSYQLFAPSRQDQNEATSAVKSALRAFKGASTQKILSAVRSAFIATERKSIATKAKYPARFHEAVKHSIGSMDPSIPDYSGSPAYSSVRGRDVGVVFDKPNIVITSRSSSAVAGKNGQYHYLTVSWPQAKKVSKVAQALSKLRGLETVQDALAMAGIKYKVHQYADPMWS